MQTTIFSLDEEGRVVTTTNKTPNWRPFEEFDGEPLDRIRLVELEQGSYCEIQLVELGTGGNFVMHTGPELAFCQIVRGKGKLGLPEGKEILYEGPELYVFHPGTLHDWHDIEDDTLLAVCQVREAD